MRHRRKAITLTAVDMGLLVLAAVSCSTSENVPQVSEQSLVGRWHFVEHGENGFDALLRPPPFAHPNELEFRRDGTFVATFGSRSEGCERELHWPSRTPEELRGTFEVKGSLGMRDLYLPRRWLAMDPGPPPRRFTVEDDTLIVHRMGDSWAEEIYKRQYLLMKPRDQRQAAATAALGR